MMHIRIAGKHIPIGEALPRYVREKISAAVGKHFAGDSEANVTFMKEKTGFRTLCCMHLCSGAKLQTEGTGPDARKAFGAALAKMEKRVHTYVGRLKDRRHGRAGQSAAGLA